MTEISRPWNGVTVGDAGPYSDVNWHELYQYIIGWGAGRANNGVFLMSGPEPDDGLKVTAPGTTAVEVGPGAALIQGIAYLNDATESFTIAANASGNPRIDTVILQADYALQTVRLAKLQGTAAASPVAPSLTQSVGVMWEIPIADVAVANGFVTITQANISPRQDWVNAPPAVYLDHVLNNSGGTLNDGDVVIWDASADRAVTTTTTESDSLVAGVWRGQTASAAYGRIQVEGIGYVNASAAVARGALLRTSTTAKQAVSFTGSGLTLARALETTAGSGLVLCVIQVAVRGIAFNTWTPYVYPLNFSVSAALTTATFLAANGGSVAIPVFVPVYMALRSVTLRNTDTSLARTWGWDLYKEINNVDSTADRTLLRVANSNGDESYTASAASNRVLAAASAPVYLEPGLYWIVIQNRHATNNYGVGSTAAGLAFGNTSQTKTTTNPNGSTLDFVAATWTASTLIWGVRLDGSVFGQSAIF